jgi:hypothetical protein
MALPRLSNNVHVKFVLISEHLLFGSSGWEKVFGDEMPLVCASSSSVRRRMYTRCV